MKLIIDSSNLMASTSIKAVEIHLRFGAENDKITLLRGSWRGLKTAVDNALANDQKYSFKHVIFAPYEATTREEFLTVIIPLFCKEFGIDPDDMLLVEHEKARSDPNACIRHMHGLPEWYNSTTNKAHDFSFDFMRQSKVAQLAAFKLGHKPVLTRHHPEIITQLRKDGEHAAADWLEAAFPLGARADSKSVPMAVVKAEEAKGHNMVEIRSVIRFAERATNTADELKAELAKHGLFIVVGKLSPPVWVVIDQSGEVVGKLAGLAHCTVAKIIQRLGEPKHDYHTENGSADQRGTRDHAAGEPVQLDLVDAIRAIGIDRAGSGPLAADDGALEEVFVAALAAPENELRLNVLYDRALNLAAGLLVQAVKLWARIERETIDWRITLGGMVLPPSNVISNARRHLMLAEAKKERAEDRWRKAEGNLAEMRMAPEPPKVGLAAHQKRIRKQERYRDRCATFTKNVTAEAKKVREQHEQFETYFARQQAEYQQEVVAPKKKYAELVLSVITRCRALVAAHPETIIYGGLALFRFGCTEAQNAPPNAKWFIDGHDDGSDHTPPDGFTLH